MDAEQYLFVYGTLMRGFPLHRLLEGPVAYAGDGEVTGLLLDLGRYPAALRDSRGTIHGEIYRVEDPALWRTLDSVEGSQYHRGEVGVRMAGGRRVTAYIYWYVAPLDRAVPIPGGDYRAHAPARSIYHP